MMHARFVFCQLFTSKSFLWYDHLGTTGMCTNISIDMDGVPNHFTAGGMKTFSIFKMGYETFLSCEIAFHPGTQAVANLEF